VPCTEHQGLPYAVASVASRLRSVSSVCMSAGPAQRQGVQERSAEQQVRTTSRRFCSQLRRHKTRALSSSRCSLSPFCTASQRVLQFCSLCILHAPSSAPSAWATEGTQCCSKGRTFCVTATLCASALELCCRLFKRRCCGTLHQQRCVRALDSYQKYLVTYKDWLTVT